MSRLIIVSNRLPVAVKETDGKLEYRLSAGGLATGLSAYLNAAPEGRKPKHLWIGWPGGSISPANRPEVCRKLQEDFDAYPVFLDTDSMENFYHGFCNSTIWPLFHYFTANTVCHEEFWASYRSVNETFCHAVMEVMQEGDVVWVHDYQLMLLPALLRKHRPKLSIGFFLHIPFPDFETFRLLPRAWKRGILEGLLGANLVGFHTHDYTQYFLRSVLRILGQEHRMGRLIAGKHIVKAATFPMGVDYRHFQERAMSAEVAREKSYLEKTLQGYKIILSVDRLDYTKGVINRLEGYEAFLEKHPEWHARVVMILIVVPSRTGVEHYQEMKKRIDELVGRINGRFGKIDWTPTRYQFDFASFESLVALYNLSDICLVTPLRDGMNLIAKEYIASRTGGSGVLVLSEMAGAAKELPEAVLVNPNSTEEITEALVHALQMPPEEQTRRNQLMQGRLERYDVVRWAGDFLNQLAVVEKEQGFFDARQLHEESRSRLIKDYEKAGRRILLLDYDGTLVGYVGDPQKANPTDRVLKTLEALTEKGGTDVVIISGRDRDTLDRWLGKLDVSMVAEHGAYVREKGSREWKPMRPVSTEWKEQIRNKLELYADRLPGSLVEEKACSLVWHYRKADPEMGAALEMELIDDLVNFTANIDLQVMQGNKIVEVRVAGVNKGAGGMHFLSRHPYDFILAVGDDWTDEDLFQVLPPEAYSIRVGMIQTHAKYNVEGPDAVLSLLGTLADRSKT